MPLDPLELADLRELVTDPVLGFLSDTAMIEPDGGGTDGRGGVAAGVTTGPTVPCRYQGSISMRGLQIIALRPANKIHAEIVLPWTTVVKNNMKLRVTRNDPSPPVTNDYTIIDIIGNTEEALVHVVVELIQ